MRFAVCLLLAACAGGPPPRPIDLPDAAGPHLANPKNGYAISILPAMVTRKPGEAQQFRVIVQGGDVSIRWRLAGKGDLGTISENGLFRAPGGRGVVQVVADVEDRGRRIGTVSAVVEVTP